MQALAFGVPGGGDVAGAGVPQHPGFLFRRLGIAVRWDHAAAGSGLGTCWSPTSVDAPADCIRVQCMDVFIGRTANQVIRAVASDFCDPVAKWRDTGQGPDGGRGQMSQTTTAR